MVRIREIRKVIMVTPLGKKKKEITISPIGYSAESVTGSCNIIEYEDTMIAVECGGIQEGHTILDNYNMNKRMIGKIKAKDLDYIFIEHLHYDHISNICSLFAIGCTAKIIAPKGSSLILKEMWLDSCKINTKDCEYLQRKTGRTYEPFYTYDDIMRTLDNITEYESNEIIELDDKLSFRYTNAGHIMLSKQLELFIKINNHVNKILVTSDLGNITTQDKRVFVENFEPVVKANIAIVESTYGLRSKRNGKKDFNKDLEKIKTVIEQYCVDRNRRCLIPTFSLDKTAIVLWYLYEMFGKDESFKVPIIVDSPLAIRLLNCYGQILKDEQKDMFEEMMSWNNIVLVAEHEESTRLIAEKGAKVVVSSGGMLQSGRSVAWAQSIIPCSNDIIIFCGYCGIDTLGWKIKNAKQQKTITINNKVLKNRCQVIDLHSFSSHMQHDDLVNYYKSIQSDRIYLIHGDLQARIELKSHLEEELSKMCKSTKVGIITKDMRISL